MSSNADDEFLADGMCEDIITALSQNPELFVIARNSTFTYKGNAIDIRQVGREQGVRFVLEGSVRRNGTRIRVTGQLIDAQNGAHIWSARYDRQQNDIFALQDEMTQKIVSALLGKLTSGLQAGRWSNGTTSFEAWEATVKAYRLMDDHNQANLLISREFAERAVELDPNFSSPFVILARTYFFEIFDGWSKDPSNALLMARKYAEEAVRLDEKEAQGWGLLGCIHMITSDFDRAYELATKATKLAPNDSNTLNMALIIMAYCGKYHEAEKLGKRAIRLYPVERARLFSTMCFNYLAMERYEEAIEYADQLCERNPDNISGTCSAHYRLLRAWAERRNAESVHRVPAVGTGNKCLEFHGFKKPCCFACREKNG